MTQPQRSAFTLVELLVVIAIVGVLVIRIQIRSDGTGTVVAE